MFEAVHRTSRRAFTLLELIVVIVILGILTAIAVPSFSDFRAKAAERVAVTNAETVARQAMVLAASDGGSLSAEYVDQAGESVDGYSSADHSVTVTSGGGTAKATIDTSTGVVTLSSAGGNGGQTLTSYLSANQETWVDANVPTDISYDASTHTVSLTYAKTLPWFGSFMTASPNSWNVTIYSKAGSMLGMTSIPDAEVTTTATTVTMSFQFSQLIDWQTNAPFTGELTDYEYAAGSGSLPWTKRFGFSA